jgi:excisionase family DNA binding protein
MIEDLQQAYMSSTDVARLLGVDRVSVAHLVRQEKIPAVKIANRWLISRAFIEEFAETYEGRRGRPRRRRKYTKRRQV